MPVHKTSDGMWQYGTTGKKYANKTDADKQARAIHANENVSGDDVRNYKPKSVSASNSGGASVGGGT